MVGLALVFVFTQLLIVFSVVAPTFSEEYNYYSPIAYESANLNQKNVFRYQSGHNTTELAEIDRKYAQCWNIKDIRELTIKQVHYYYKTNQLSVFQLTSCYLKRIEKMNPFLHAVIEINPDAIRQALKLDYERYLGYKYSYEGVFGIPILIKDNIATVDAMQTCSGSLALVGYKPIYPATIVLQLLLAKVVILGKSNLSEFANFRDFDIPNGWSGRGGQTHNPYSVKIDPSGSSTGSAVSVAANLCMASMGTETDGSIVAPAEKGSICGLKTSRGGVVSIKGIIPISAYTQDTAGPFTRTIQDLMLIMRVFYQKDDVKDTLSSYENECQNELDQNRKFRIGIFRKPFWEWKSNDTVQRQKILLLEKTLKKLKTSPQIVLVDPVKAPKGAVEKVTGDNVIITFLHEFKDSFNKYLKQVKFVGDKSSYNSPPNYPERHPLTLKDIIQYNNEHPVPEGYEQQKLEESQKTDGISNSTYRKARNENVHYARSLFDWMFRYYDLDALAAPIAPGWFTTNDASLYSYAAVAGYPYIIVPAGFVNTFDAVGLIFHGPLHSEKTLLCIAKIYEEKTRARRMPTFAP